MKQKDNSINNDTITSNSNNNSIVRINSENDNDIVSNDKEGLLRKRSGRMHRWSHRYFILNGPQLSYKIKKESDKTRGSFDLVPGCIVTEVLEESIGAIKGKKIFSFWVVWPHDKREKEKQEKKNKKKSKDNNNADNKSDKSDKSDNDDESDDDDDDDDDNDDEAKIEEAIAIPIKDTKNKSKDDEKSPALVVSKQKDLKHIVETEVMTVRQQQKQVEEQLERHHAHDKNVSLGVKVAAVAVGGVVIGALTAGIGLIPYITVVGITAVVGGGAVLAVRKPSDSRLILAAETMWDALAWKNAIEMEIQRLEENRKPIMPSSTDPNIISFLMGTSINSQTWKKVGLVEGMRIMQQQTPMEGTICRRSQLIITMPPVTAFLAIMEGNCWPKYGSVKVVKVIDDHADIIEITTNTSYIPGKYFGRSLIQSRTIYFNRFWKLDDDGIYLIALTSCDYKHDDNKNDIDNKNNNNTNSNSNNNKVKEFDPAITAVMTVSPRRDNAEYYDDLSISLVSCTCQISSTTTWKKGELNHFINQFLTENLLELQQLLMTNKYAIDDISHRNTDIPLAIPYPEDTNTKNSNNNNNNKNNNNKKLKIATVQPGLEEMGMIALNDKTSSSSSSSSSLVPIEKSLSTSTDAKKPAEQEQPKKRRLFRTSFSATTSSGTTTTPTKALSDDDASKSKPSTGKKRFLFKSSSAKSDSTPEDSNKTNTTSSDTKPLSTLSRVIGRKRGKVNTEASTLRSQIAAKEYEIQRLERLKRKDASNELNVNLQQQQAELDSLKKKYLTVSGEHYEQSRRGSIRNFITQPDNKKENKMDQVDPVIEHAPISSIPSTDQKNIPKEADNNLSIHKKPDIKTKLDEGLYQRPMHWQPERNDSDAARLRVNDNFTSADARVNIVMVLMFSLSMIATMLLANILSQF